MPLALYSRKLTNDPRTQDLKRLTVEKQLEFIDRCEKWNRLCADWNQGAVSASRVKSDLKLIEEMSEFKGFPSARGLSIYKTFLNDWKVRIESDTVTELSSLWENKIFDLSYAVSV